MYKGSIDVQGFYTCARVLSVSFFNSTLRTISFSDPQLFFCTMPFDDNKIFQMDDDPSCVDPGSVF